MHSPTGRDKSLLLDAAYDLATVDRGPDLPATALRWLTRLVPGDRAGWIRINAKTGRFTGQHLPAAIPELLRLLPRELARVPLADELITRPGLDVRKISDRWSLREWRSQPMFELYRMASTVHQIVTPLTTYQPGVKEISSLTVSRTRGDFNERDRAVLTEFGRHLGAATRRLMRSHEELGLTQRQSEAIQAISDGASMAVAARRLGITAKTLDNHLQAAYRRLGVTNRVAALQSLRDFPHCRRQHGAMS